MAAESVRYLRQPVASGGGGAVATGARTSLRAQRAQDGLRGPTRHRARPAASRQRRLRVPVAPARVLTTSSSSGSFSVAVSVCCLRLVRYGAREHSIQRPVPLREALF